MSQQRLKRIAALEAKKPIVVLRVDADAAADSLRWVLTCHDAVEAGKACLVPRFGPPREPSDAMRRVLQQLDSIAARLAAEGRG